MKIMSILQPLTEKKKPTKKKGKGLDVNPILGDLLKTKGSQIQELILNTAGSKVANMAKDTSFFDDVIGSVHKKLPLAIRAVVSREKFIEFCEDNKNTILKMVLK